MITRRRALQIFAASATIPTTTFAQDRRFALGADVSMNLRGPDEITTAARIAAWAEIDRIEDLFSLYKESDLTRLNRDGVLRKPAPEFAELLQLCDTIHRATDGRFDPTVQPLWLAHAQGSDISTARDNMGWHKVSVTDDAIQLGQGQALTLNGIAQGYATDRVTKVLKDHGLSHALVNIGEYCALSGPWQLGLSDPAFGQLGQFTLTDRATATSSPAAMRLPDGTAHILDPTGANDIPQWSTVSVCAPSAAMADGLSTALCHASTNEIPLIAARLDVPLTIRLIDLSGNLRTL
jgi:thiamine biosynthesis lipoprotein